MLSVLDVFVFIILAIFLAWGVYRQTIGMMVSWFGFYLAVLLAGLVDLIISGTHGFGMRIIRSLGGSSESTRLLQIGFFFAVLVGTWIIYHLLFNLAFQEEPFPSFGILDGILGGLLGLALGIVASAVLVNLWRVTVGTAWQPMDLWQRMYNVYYTSLLPAYLRPALRLLNQFLPFFSASRPLPLTL